MVDTIGTEDTEPTDIEDVKVKLDGLLGWIQDKKTQSEVSKTPWGWLMGSIAAILVFVCLAFLAYSAWNKGKKMAQLLHKVDVDAEAKKKAELDAKISKSVEFISAQEEFIKRMDKQIAKTGEEIRILEKERLNLTEKIDKVTSWADLDDLRGGKQ